MYEYRKRTFCKMKQLISSFAADIGETVYDVKDNHISLALTLSSIPAEKQTLFGSILFNRGITGARVVSSTIKKTTVEGYEFINFGSHSNEQHGGYLNVACAIGMTEIELEDLVVRLRSIYIKFSKQNGMADVSKELKVITYDENDD
uniref:Sep-tRNA:Sec-tRNA synthase n=1 Tax=Heterorhabditis bacteriophora TaxID=37862 RepID=A0A1I7XMX3_HETBA